MLLVIMLSVMMLGFTFFIGMLSVIMLNAITLNNAHIVQYNKNALAYSCKSGFSIN
jgi:hypothetical protein